MTFPESKLAHRYLDGLDGIEIGGSAHNPFGLRTRNVDFTDDMTTVFKREEERMCGRAMPVDIVAPGDRLPLHDRSVDFVLSSHVIEHFFDPIGALLEWHRVARKYVYVIVPQRNALPADRDLPLTTMDEFLRRRLSARNAPRDPREEPPWGGHWSRWTSETFVRMVVALGIFHVAEVQDPDDKVGNGFAVVLVPLHDDAPLS